MNAPARRRARTTDAKTPPTREALHEAALAYLARSSASAASVGRVLERKVARWAHAAARSGRDGEEVATDVAACRASIDAIVARFREVGLIDDLAYARSRARSLARSGRSRRAIGAHLAAKGVDAEVAREALPNDADLELDAALVFARKRRVGPFAREPIAALDRTARQVARQKELAAMARAGFAFSTCERALGMEREQAEERLASSRSRD